MRRYNFDYGIVVNTPMNTYASVARKIVDAGLYKKSLALPDELYELTEEMYNVPERPEDYQLRQEKPVTEVAVLVTGGLDSTALYLWACSRQHEYPTVHAYYIDAGMGYCWKERNALDALAIPHTVIESDALCDESHFWKHIIPGRNFLFMSLVAEYMHTGGTILFGETNGEIPETGGDKSVRFIGLVNRLFSLLPYPVKVSVPFASMTKGEIVNWFISRYDPQLLNYTISCYSSKEAGHCGRCQACVRKALAFASNGIVLHTNTPVLEGGKEYIDKYIRLMTQALEKDDYSHYSKKRCLEDLAAIQVLQSRS